MKCVACQHQFCWRCLGEYPGYQHSDYDNGKVCGQRQFSFFLVYVTCALAIYIKVLCCLRQLSDYLGYSVEFEPSTSPDWSLLGYLMFLTTMIKWCFFLLKWSFILLLGLGFSLLLSVTINPKLFNRRGLFGQTAQRNLAIVEIWFAFNVVKYPFGQAIVGMSCVLVPLLFITKAMR